MRTAEFLEIIFTNPTLMGRIQKPPILIPAQSAHPNVILDMEEGYRFPRIAIYTHLYPNFYDYHFLSLDFELPIPIRDNFIFTKEKKFGGSWRFLSYNPQEIKNLSVDESIKLIRKNAKTESENESGLLEYLNEYKMKKYLKYLTMKIKEKQVDTIYTAQIYYPIKVDQSEDKKVTIIEITSFTRFNKIKLDHFFTIANAVANAIRSYKTGQ
ncbi:MAG: hypothetical protein GF329_02565 [Candidatus Lokiarchaeota archaeon]|nr:hypothetical protein [Candidatus Lokiarchaeota archaeon]